MGAFEREDLEKKILGTFAALALPVKTLVIIAKRSGSDRRVRKDEESPGTTGLVAG